MPASLTYGLYSFTWDAAAKCHSPPAGSACVLDFRPISEQARQGQSAGYGLFAWAASPPGDLVSLGTGYAPELAISNAARNELKQKLGLSGNPSGATLADVIADILGPLSDPKGASGPRPLMPSASGTLEIHLDGHSRIWSQVIDAAELLSANPKGRHNRIRDVIRADLDIAEAIGGAPLLQKALGAVLKKCGYSDGELRAGAGGRAAEWQRLLSPAVKAKHGGNAKPGKPTTSVSESFPNDSGSLSGSSQDQSWTTPIYALAVVSGAARGTLAGNDCWGICGSAVSSADHIAYCDTTSNTGYVGPASRVATTGMTGYIAMRTGTQNQLWKVVAGTFTALTAAAPGAGARFSCRSNGSTHTLSSTGQSPVSVTDTAITGNLRGGLYIYPAGSLTAETADNWTLDDELSDELSGGATCGMAIISGNGFF